MKYTLTGPAVVSRLWVSEGTVAWWEDLVKPGFFDIRKISKKICMKPKLGLFCT